MKKMQGEERDKDLRGDAETRRELPKGWGTCSLGSVCRILTGRLDASEANTNGKYPFFTCATEVSRINHYDFDTEAVLLAGNGGFDVKHYIGKFNAYQRTYILIPGKCNGRYLFFTIKNFIGKIASENRGSTIKYLRRGDIENVIIPLPPLPEQERIAARLDLVLGKLKVARKRLDGVPEIIKRFKKSVLAQAVSGRLTEEWRTEHASELPSAEELFANVRAERRAAWEKAELEKLRQKGRTPKDDSWKAKYVEPESVDASELGELPEGWVWVSADSVGDIQLGRQRAPKYHNGKSMHPYLRVQNIFEDRIDISDVMEMDFSKEDFDTYKLEYGDILLNEGQSPEFLGRPAIFRNEIKDVCFTNTLIRFKAGSNTTPKYSLCTFRHHMHSGRYIREGTITTNIAHLGAGRFASVEFPLPSLLEQTEIVRRVDELIDLVDALEQRVADARKFAERLEPSILAKAFRGELSEQIPEEAAEWERKLAEIEAATSEMGKAVSEGRGAKKKAKAGVSEKLEAAEASPVYGSVPKKRGRPRKS